MVKKPIKTRARLHEQNACPARRGELLSGAPGSCVKPKPKGEALPPISTGEVAGLGSASVAGVSCSTKLRSASQRRVHDGPTAGSGLDNLAIYLLILYRLGCFSIPRTLCI